MVEASAAPVIAPERSRGWTRAAVLFAVAMATAVIAPTVLVGLPLLLMGFVLGVRRLSVFAVALLAMLVVMNGGERDALWYLERGWTFLAGGLFVALTVRNSSWSFSGRAIAAVAGATGLAAAFFGIRSGSWGVVEWVVEEQVGRGISTAMEAISLVRGGEGLPPSLASAVYETVQTQIMVFPALVGVSSIAGLGVAWWIYVRLSSGSDQGLGPLRDFRFNDQLVWVFIAGLLLLLSNWADVATRLGANTVVLMGALYAARGAAVILFLSGGLSLIGYVLLAFGLVFLPPLVLTGAMVIGIGDTWVDVRRRSGSKAA